MAEVISKNDAKRLPHHFVPNSFDFAMTYFNLKSIIRRLNGTSNNYTLSCPATVSEPV